jgi:hypothetical protein
VLAARSRSSREHLFLPDISSAASIIDYRSSLHPTDALNTANRPMTQADHFFMNFAFNLKRLSGEGLGDC